MEKDFNYIASVEKAVRDKYGDAAVENPNKSWTPEKETEYLEQLKKIRDAEDREDDKIEIEGILISKRLFSKDISRTCSVCSKYSFNKDDDIYQQKYECCQKCYIIYVEGREKRWLSGWRPKIDGNDSI